MTLPDFSIHQFDMMVETFRQCSNQFEAQVHRLRSIVYHVTVVAGMAAEN